MDKESLLSLVGLVTLAYHMIFIYKGTKDNDEFKNADWYRQKIMAFEIGFSAPWKTRFYWGGGVQLLLYFLGFWLQC